MNAQPVVEELPVVAGEMEAHLNIHSSLEGVGEVRAELQTGGGDLPVGGNLTEGVSDELHLEGGCARSKAEDGQQGRRMMWAKTLVVSLGRSRCS